MGHKDSTGAPLKPLTDVWFHGLHIINLNTEVRETGTGTVLMAWLPLSKSRLWITRMATQDVVASWYVQTADAFMAGAQSCFLVASWLVFQSNLTAATCCGKLVDLRNMANCKVLTSLMF